MSGNLICFVDTETTSLRHDRRAWEIAVIARKANGKDVEHQWFVDAFDLDLGNADVMSLKIGRFYDRHPQYQLGREPYSTETGDEADVLRLVEAITRGAHIVGAVPSFDTDVLGQRMRANGICPSWHYHVQDIETLIIGYLRERGEPVPLLPWRFDDLSRLIGVEPPGDDERHSALGDARWAMRVWDTVMGP